MAMVPVTSRNLRDLRFPKLRIRCNNIRLLCVSRQIGLKKDSRQEYEHGKHCYYRLRAGRLDRGDLRGAGELRGIERFLHGGVAAAHHSQDFIAIDGQRSVANGTRGNAATR